MVVRACGLGMAVRARGLRMAVRVCLHGTWQVGEGRLRHSFPQPHSKFEASLGYEPMSQESRHTNSAPHETDDTLIL